MGWGYAQNTKILFSAAMSPRKHHFWSFLAITIAVYQIQLILHSHLFKIYMLGWGYAQNIKILFSAVISPRKHHFWSFLAITIAVCQIQMILILSRLQNEHDGMGICAKHKNFIQCGTESQKTPFLVVFGYNKCSVSNPNDFNTHTSTKSTCWDGDMSKTQKFYSERKGFLENTTFGRFWL